MDTVIRITRHNDPSRVELLKSIFGDDTQVITDDIPYGNDPVRAIKDLIDQLENSGHKVLAVEATAPFSVLVKLINERANLGVKFIRAVFRRGEDGRNAVVGKDGNGRDIFDVEGYEELERIEFQTRRL